MFWPLLLSLGSIAVAVRTRPPLRPDSPYTEAQLRDPPFYATEDEKLWLRYVVDRWRPGPPAPAPDTKPTTRKLNDFERWALAPYFPVVDDLEATIHNGMMLHDAEAPPNMWSVTDTNGEIWFPNAARDFRSLWWLGLLAHELTHRAQRRIGLTGNQAIQSLLIFGYSGSPVERQARWMQGQVMRDLAQRARSYLHA